MSNFQMLSLKKTPMQAIYESTCVDLIKEISQNLAEDKPTLESFTSIHGVDKCVQEINFSDTIQKMYKKYHNPNIPSRQKNNSGSTVGENEVMAFKYFRDYMDISKVGSGDMSIKQCVDMTASLYADIGGDLYGVLMMNNKGVMFNPLHPVLVAEMQKENTSISMEEPIWTMAVYTWKNKDEYESSFKTLFEKEDYIHEIATLVTSINSPAHYVVENSDFQVEIVNDQFILNYKEVKIDKSTGEKYKDDSVARNYLAPCQVINVSGVAYPYYGSVYSRKGLAWNMTPMYSANISHPRDQSTSSGADGGSRICTHSGNSKTQIGVSALNHSNTTSALNSYSLRTGAFEYGRQAMEASLEMLTGPSEKEEKVLSFQEFVEENDGADKKQYLAYIRNRMKDKMIDTEEQEVLDVEALKADFIRNIPEYTPGVRYKDNDLCFHKAKFYICHPRDREYKEHGGTTGMPEDSTWWNETEIKPEMYLPEGYKHPEEEEQSAPQVEWAPNLAWNKDDKVWFLNREYTYVKERKGTNATNPAKSPRWRLTGNERPVTPQPIVDTIAEGE